MAATAILWSSFGISVKIVDWNPFAISAGRSISAVFFLLLIVRRKKGRPSSGRNVHGHRACSIARGRWHSAGANAGVARAYAKHKRLYR